jgi:RHS repeat-associated protein
MSYTPVDLLQKYTPPTIPGDNNPTFTQYSYDADRFLTNVQRPDGISVNYNPDTAGRLSSIAYNNPQGTVETVSFAPYDPTTGKLTKSVSAAEAGGECTQFTYDGSLPKTLTWGGASCGPISGALAFGYNSDFNVYSQSINGGTPLLFGYDNDRLLTSAGAITIARDTHNGLLSGTTLGSVADSYNYDPNGLFASYTAKFGTSVLYTETIVTRDANGRIKEKKDIFGSVTAHDWVYQYDPAGRLTDAQDGVNPNSHYGYDSDDNRNLFVPGGGTAVLPSYDTQDRLKIYGSKSFAYTENGELLSKTEGGQQTTYAYDPFGNLLHVGLPSGSGGTNIDYVIDAQNRRVGKKVNGALTQGFLYQDQLHVVALLDGGNNIVERFVYGSKPNVPDYFTTSAGTYRILSDHLGSPRLVIDSSGNLIESISYDEFGNETDVPISPLPSGYQLIPFGFAGGLYDTDTKFVRFGARDYDASVGRWTTKDPIGFNGGNNQYIYALNDPVNARDQDGLQSCACGEQASAAIYVGPWDAWLAYRDAQQAKAEAEATGLSGSIGGLQDAFRHCDWSCLLARDIGPSQASIIGSLHEVCNPSDQNMDLYNNGVGRDLALSSDLPCEQACLGAIYNGKVWRTSSSP